MTPLAGVGMICVFFARKYTLKRNFVKAEEQTRPGSSGSGSTPGAGKEVDNSGKVTPESDQVVGGEEANKDINV